jgi:hypothetical protein
LTQSPTRTAGTGTLGGRRSNNRVASGNSANISPDLEVHTHNLYICASCRGRGGGPAPVYGRQRDVGREDSERTSAPRRRVGEPGATQRPSARPSRLSRTPTQASNHPCRLVRLAHLPLSSVSSRGRGKRTMSSLSDRQPVFRSSFPRRARGRGAAARACWASRAHACDRAWQIGREGAQWCGLPFGRCARRGIKARGCGGCWVCGVIAKQANQGGRWARGRRAAHPATELGRSDTDAGRGTEARPLGSMNGDDDGGGRGGGGDAPRATLQHIPDDEMMKTHKQGQVRTSCESSSVRTQPMASHMYRDRTRSRMVHTDRPRVLYRALEQPKSPF